ncbi:hypothetical protein HNQ71_006992 [Mesorhizobium sangaii]|uniref:Transposase DDE domain-containing protein n=1 Tax=Mesorhizobium sangaii TaxID=505389 RepID=A0A841PKZ6_9HYPH|nr:hypothetical protein [Mesorhizobium sangaii]
MRSSACSPTPATAATMPRKPPVPGLHQKHRVTPAIKREMRRMGHNYLAGEHGDAINAVLAASGYNFSILLNWLRMLLWLLLPATTAERNRARLAPIIVHGRQTQKRSQSSATRCSGEGARIIAAVPTALFIQASPTTLSLLSDIRQFVGFAYLHTAPWRASPDARSPHKTTVSRRPISQGCSAPKIVIRSQSRRSPPTSASSNRALGAECVDCGRSMSR